VREKRGDYVWVLGVEVAVTVTGTVTVLFQWKARTHAHENYLSLSHFLKWRMARGLVGFV